MSEALEARRITLGNRHLSTLSSVNNLGRLLKDKGDLAAAEPLLREAMEGRREALGARHPIRRSPPSKTSARSRRERAASPPRTVR